MNKLAFFRFNDVINRDVFDEFGESLGLLKDVYTTSENGTLRVIGYKIKRGSLILDYEFRSINFFEKDNGRIKILTKGSREILPRTYSYLLFKDLLNNKVVDLTTKKVVKVNDLAMEEMAGEIRVTKVECYNITKYKGATINKLLGKVLPLIGKKAEKTVLRCDEIEVIKLSEGALNISSRFNKLSAMHPADLADIIEDLDVTQRREIFENLDQDLIADTLEEVEHEMKGEIIKELSESKVVEVLESMPNDEIADMLDELDDEEREKLLVSLHNEDAAEVKELLKYEDETVGSIMNTDCITINLDITIRETIELIKELDPDEEVMHNVYITDNDGRIVGVVGLKDILLNSDEINSKRKLKEFAVLDVKSLNYKGNIGEAVEAMDKYDLLSIPVVDEDNKILGAVLIHDVIDEALYPVWKKKNRAK
ncbi:magnesium transporter MgtE N-terminal domain-containing protein [Inconstantimicrobium mannanitabidum]|uniref:magnesium transporter MgtE N-terminal domain-containing protein n=1 Tax=Inconstantimicrobium mannanitabidum TaxID=1604901 RepID=UPI0021C2CC52|nr:CBS domain-containing protein [Clostridium sp. TW13]